MRQLPVVTGRIRTAGDDDDTIVLETLGEAAWCAVEFRDQASG